MENDRVSIREKDEKREEEFSIQEESAASLNASTLELLEGVES